MWRGGNRKTTAPVQNVDNMVVPNPAPAFWRNSMRILQVSMSILFGTAFIAFPFKAVALDQKVDQQNVKTLAKQIDNLEKQAMDAQAASIGLIGTISDSLSKKARETKENLQSDVGFKEDLTVRVAAVQDIEKTRMKLKRDIGEWTENIDYTEIDEIKKGIADALAVAEADGLDIAKLTDLYERTKAVVRTTSFRQSEATIEDRMKNLDLDRDAVDLRLKELWARHEALRKEIESTSMVNLWTRKMLELDLAAVDFEILQHLMNVRHDDISQPMYVAMDGILSGFLWAGEWGSRLAWRSDQWQEGMKASGLDAHEFDSQALGELPRRYFQKLVTLGFEGEALAAEARAARQRHRLNFYKRAAIAFIRALISAKDTAGHCQAEDKTPITIDFGGEKIKTLGCPDPVVQNLRAYLDAIRKFESAEADRLVAEAEKLVAEQQIIADFMAAVPLVGDALDLYSVYAGESLAGLKLSPIERGLIGVLTALPMVGPHALKQIETRAPESVLVKLEGIKAYLEAVVDFGVETAGDLGAARREIARFVTEDFAEIAGTDVKSLERLYRLLQEPGGIMAAAAKARKESFEAARARMQYFKTVREAAEDRIALATLKNSDEYGDIYRRAMQDSDQLIERNLIGFYNGGLDPGSWRQRAQASNIPEPMLREFENLSKLKEQAYVVRPVGPDAAQKIAEDVAGTKPMAIKAKSSNWGPQKAYIPVEQRFSKLGNPDGIDPDAIAKYQAKVKACLSEIPPCSNTVDLKVKVGGEEFDVMIVGKEPGGMPAYRDSQGVLRDPETLNPLRGGPIDTSDIRPMKVFADEYGNPLTADFDLLAVGSMRSLDAPSAGRGAGFDLGAQQRAPREAGPKGTTTKEIDEAADGLNAGSERAGFTHGKVVHHGPEVFNPASKEVFTKSEINEQLRLTVVDPKYGVLTIPACDEDCMKLWCRESGLCDPANVCPEIPSKGCIPVDVDRLVKDYFQNARMRGIDLFPHPSWNWGRHNPLSGWNLTSFLDGVPAEVFPKVQGAGSAYLESKRFSGYFGGYLRVFKKFQREGPNSQGNSDQ
jgi:hypothetical protein